MRRPGKTYRRCRTCGKTVQPGARACRCGSDRVAWAYVVDTAQEGEARRQTARTGFATKGEAAAAMAKVQEDAEAGLATAPDTMVAAWLDQWLPSIKGRVRGGTWANYELTCRLHIVPAIGQVRLRRLTGARVRALYADLGAAGPTCGGMNPDSPAEPGRRPLSPKSVHNVHQVLHGALKAAVEDGLVTRNVADNAHSLGTRRPTMRTWDGAQVARFLEATKDDRFAALWRLYVTTGLRRGEAIALRWQDVDLERGFLSVTRSRSHGLHGMEYGEPKTAAGRRRVALGAATVAALRAHRAAQEVIGIEGLVFDRGDGLPLDPDGVTGAFVRLSRAAGLPRIRLHDLRHTSASLMLAAGVNAKVVSERLGHSSISVTMDLYSHVAPGIQEDAAERLERAIGP